MLLVLFAGDVEITANVGCDAFTRDLRAFEVGVGPGFQRDFGFAFDQSFQMAVARLVYLAARLAGIDVDAYPLCPDRDADAGTPAAALGVVGFSVLGAVKIDFVLCIKGDLFAPYQGALGFGDDFDDFSPGELKSTNVQPIRTPPADKTKAAKAAAETGFSSRPAVNPVEKEAKSDATAEVLPRRDRRRRTGRDTQFNMKVKRETKIEWEDIADNNGWTVGEALEHAIPLMKKKYPGT